MSIQSAKALVKERMRQHIAKRAQELSQIAKDLHREAPRGGKAKNYFGERRSAPQEQPATEFGGLLTLIHRGVEVEADGMEATVMVNLAVLEFGKRDKTLQPRPLGRMSVNELKKRVPG